MRKRLLVGIASLIVCGVAGGAEAAPITFVFTATVTDTPLAFAPTISLGDTINGSFTFESNTPDTTPDPSFATYLGAITSVTATVGTYSLSSSGGRITTSNVAVSDTFQIFGEPVLRVTNRRILAAAHQPLSCGRSGHRVQQ